jgi:TetR/AcrR family transcriptional regulator
MNVEQTDPAIPLKPVGGRSGTDTKQRLLAVATAQFAEHGYDGARVDRIVAECGVSKNLLYHYFSSKEALFVAVMEQAYQQMRAHQSEWSFVGMEPGEAISRLVVLTFDHFLENPSLISLLNSENLHKARHIARSKGIPELYDPLLTMLSGLLARGEREGRFQHGIDPVDLYISISALSYFYLSNRYTLSHVFQEDLLAPERLARRRKHVVDVILGYLRR